MAKKDEIKEQAVQSTEVDQTQITPDSDDNFMFAIGTPEGDLMVKVGTDGNITYLKDGATLGEAAKAFWNSFQGFLPISEDEVLSYANDAELGAYVRSKMKDKMENLY